MIREDDRNVLILHSSGTTGQSAERACGKRGFTYMFSGLPKAIPLAHRYVLGYAACHEFPVTEDLSLGGYNLSTLPLFHVRAQLPPKSQRARLYVC